MTRETITAEIRAFVAGYDSGVLLDNTWRAPLVGFADASTADLEKLKLLVDPGHELPGDVLADARIIIAYFVPFSAAVITSNKGEGFASPQWAMAYEKTNAMIPKLNAYMTAYLNRQGNRASVSKEAAVFDREKILSRWSQRYIAYLAGLGTFGLNNMLITEAGCCGRFGSLVTNLDLTPDTPLVTENCLHKRSGICQGLCRALFDRRAQDGLFRSASLLRSMLGERPGLYPIWEFLCLESRRRIDGFRQRGVGKCLVGLPCSMKKP